MKPSRHAEDFLPISEARIWTLSAPARAVTLLLPLFLFLAGIALAIHYRESNTSPGESGLAAISFLRTGTIANPYLFPTGPTAHVSPLLVFYLSAVFAVLGENSDFARIFLSIVAAASYSMSAYLTLRLCSRGRVIFWLSAVLMLALPLFLFESVIYARQWDQPFAGLLVIATASLLLSNRKASLPALLQIAVLCGLGSVLSPALMPTLISALAMYIWAGRAHLPVWKGIALSIFVISGCLLPWAIRNEMTMGKLIITRSDFPLEFAVGNALGATGLSGSGVGWALHPHDSPPAAIEMAKIGEVRYMDRMMKIGVAGVREGVGNFIILTCKRISYTLLQWPNMVSWKPPFGDWAASFALLFGTLHVLSLVLIFLVRGPGVFALVFSILPLAPYWVTHVNFRYLSVVYFPSVIVIAWALSNSVTFASRRLRRNS
jgi:hypothetical protein